MTAIATAPARVRPDRAAPRPTPRSVPTTGRARPTPARPELRVVAPPARRYPARAVAVVAVVLVFGSLLVSAMFHSTLVTGQARIDDLGRQITAEQKGLAQDRLLVAEMSSPARIAAEAERLGLVPAERQTWIRPGSGNAPVVTGADAEAGSDTDTDTDPDGSTSAGGGADGVEELAATPTADGARR